MLTLKQNQNMARDLLDRDINRDKKFRAMDTMFYNTAKAPSGFPNWFRWVPSTVPSDAVWGAARVLSSLEPEVKFFPVASDPKTIEQAGRIERIVKYQWLMAAQRSKSKPTRQITLSSILYDMVAIQTSFLPWQVNNIDVMGGDKKKLRSTQLYGQFAFHVRSPKYVHPVHSEWGLETVLFEQVVGAREALSFWGNKINSKTRKKIKSGDIDYLYVLDLWDGDNRTVWAQEGDHSGSVEGNIVIIEPQKTGIPFIPWIIKGGGSTLETDPALHHRPMLDSVYATKQYDTLNIMQSLLISTAVKQHSRSRLVTKTFSGEAPEIDYESPEDQINLRPGEDAKDLPPGGLDPGLLTLNQALQDAISASTVSRVLLGNVPNQVAYATLNLGQQSAARSIIPYQESAQDAVAEAMTQQLLWSHFAKEDIRAWGISDDPGQRYVIRHNEIDPDHIMFQAKLVADVPSDRLSKINGGNMMLQAGVPKKQVFEEWGIGDPQKAMDDKVQETLAEMEIANIVKQETGAVDLQLQAQAMQMQVQAQQQPQQPAHQPAQGPSGQGFNTSGGGQAPVLADRSMLRETVQGVDRRGEPIGQ